MTGEYRTALKLLIDQARRTQIHSNTTKLCKGCGTPWGNYTDGCTACYDRKRRAWKRSVRMQPALHKPGTCKGCGVPYREHTPGCIRCTDRKRYHKARTA